MSEHVVVRSCRYDTVAKDVTDRVVESINQAAIDVGKLGNAKRVLMKPNLGIGKMDEFRSRRTTIVDLDVFEGVCRYIREHTDAEILYGDGMSGIDIREAVVERGYAEIADRYRIKLIDMHEAPYEIIAVPKPAMFRRYTISKALEGIDFVVSIAKMKSHHLCGVSLSQKNLFGIPPGPVYGNPRLSLHSTVRLPLLLVDLAQLFPPDLCVIDGIIGGNFGEWHGDPVSSGLLVAGKNCVAVDATAARLMHVDPKAKRGTSPFYQTDSHIAVASEHGLGPIDSEEIEVGGDPPEVTLPYSVNTHLAGDQAAVAAQQRAEHLANAADCFERLETYENSHKGEVIVVHEGELVAHAPATSPLSEWLKPIRERGLGPYEPFFKLVESDDPELREPYIVST